MRVGDIRKITMSAMAHTNHVTTCVRFSHTNGYSYDERAFFGSHFPARLFACDTIEGFILEVDRSTSEDHDPKRDYLPEFNGFFNIVIEYDDLSDLSKFTVAEARRMEGVTGAYDVNKVFKIDRVKGKLIYRVFEHLEYKDVDALKKQLDALKTLCNV